MRDCYPLGPGKRLLITTDRLSAFDRILARVPYKGQVLNQLAPGGSSRPRHHPQPRASRARPQRPGGAEAEPFPVEVIVRGYITGVTSTALWYRYSLGERDIYGYRFPDGLRKNQALPEPIITPTTKGGPTGHDERLTCAEVVERGCSTGSTWEQVQAAALAIFKRGQAGGAARPG